MRFWWLQAAPPHPILDLLFLWGLRGGGLGRGRQGSGTVAGTSGPSPAGCLQAVLWGEENPASGRGVPDHSHLGLIYLASTKSLQVFPVSGGAEVSAAVMALATSPCGGWDTRTHPHPGLPLTCLRTHRTMEASGWLYAPGAWDVPQLSRWRRLILGCLPICLPR